MDRPVVEPNTTVVIAPAEGVLEPIFVVSLRKIFPGSQGAGLSRGRSDWRCSEPCSATAHHDGPLLEEGLRKLDEVIEMMHSDLSVTDRSTWAPRLSVRPIAE